MSRVERAARTFIDAVETARGLDDAARTGPAYELLRAAVRTEQRIGDRVEDGGQMGTLVRCDKCGGDGLLHDPDEPLPVIEPDEPPPAIEPLDGLAGSCCRWHSRACEPPSELCCCQCTERAHPGHADGSACIAPDLSAAARVVSRVELLAAARGGRSIAPAAWFCPSCGRAVGAYAVSFDEGTVTMGCCHAVLAAPTEEASGG